MSQAIPGGVLKDFQSGPAHLRYQERVEDSTFKEGGEIPLEEIM